jgi:hypothetical protein
VALTRFEALPHWAWSSTTLWNKALKEEKKRPQITQIHPD